MLKWCKQLDKLPNLSQKAKHEKTLEYLAENGIRTLGPPCIGIYGNKLRPERLHCKIYSWQDFLDLVYHESLIRGQYNEFIAVLEGPVQPYQELENSSDHATKNKVVSAKNDTEPQGAGARVKAVAHANQQNAIFLSTLENSCTYHFATDLNFTLGVGLPFIAKQVKQHHDNAKICYNKLQVRLIGVQAIKLAQYYYRLVDCIACENKSEAQKLIRLSLSKIGQMLRDAGSLFNKINCNNSDLELLSETLSIYYNLHALFFPDRVTLTVWTMGCALRYHAVKLYNEYSVGYGIVSCQSKEAKHASVKKDLSLSNRHMSNSITDNKWWQVFRAEYIRCFYIPEFHPQPCSFSFHYASRVPKHCSVEGICSCGRDCISGYNECKICLDSAAVVECGKNGKMSGSITEIILPMLCSNCNSRFSDKASLDVHTKTVHVSNICNLTSDPKTMGKAALAAELRKRGLSTKGGVGHAQGWQII